MPHKKGCLCKLCKLERADEEIRKELLRTIEPDENESNP